MHPVAQYFRRNPPNAANPGIPIDPEKAFYQGLIQGGSAGLALRSASHLDLGGVVLWTLACAASPYLADKTYQYRHQIWGFFRTMVDDGCQYLKTTLANVDKSLKPR